MSIEDNETYRRVREKVPVSHPHIVYGEYRVFSTTAVRLEDARKVIVLAYKAAQSELRRLGYDIHEESSDVVYVEGFRL